MLRDIHRWFETILQPNTPDFNPLPAAANCLLDPSPAAVLMEPDQATIKRGSTTSALNVRPPVQNSRQPWTVSGFWHPR